MNIDPKILALHEKLDILTALENKPTETIDELRARLELISELSDGLRGVVKGFTSDPDFTTRLIISGMVSRLGNLSASIYRDMNRWETAVAAVGIDLDMEVN